LKLDLEHLDRPAAFLAVYGAASAQRASATEAATLTLHERLIRHLASNRSEWSDEMLCDGLAGLLSGLASEHADAKPLAAVMLVAGNRVVTMAMEGACAAFVRADAAGKEVMESAVVAEKEASGGAIAEAETGAASSSAAAASTSIRPACHTLSDGSDQSGYVVMFAGDGEVADDLSCALDEVVPHLAAARPKAASVAVLRAARSRKAVGALVSACARLGPMPEASGPSLVDRPAKKLKSEETAGNMVRVRQILLRHWKGSGPEPMDPIRRKAVRRSQEEAELQMLQVIEGLMKEGLSSFSSACKASSECQSALKGGELAGDIGWLDKEKGQNAKQAAVPAPVLRVAFDLEVGQLGDLVSSDVGTHLCLRTA